MIGRALVGVSLLLLIGVRVQGHVAWPFEVTDYRDREKLTILIFGDSGTGEAGQYRVGDAMYRVCRERGCDLALMLGDNIYEDGIEIASRDDVEASFREVQAQFRAKFEAPYESFTQIPGFLFWVILGNHDYRDNAVGTMVTYSEFSPLWRLPRFHYEIPLLPDWITIYGLHTDTDEGRDLNGVQVVSAQNVLCRKEDGEGWKLAFGHQPVHNSGHHRNDSEEKRTRALLEEPLLRKCGVDVYFSGHAHHQEHITARGYEQVIQGAAARTKGSNRGPAKPGVEQRYFSKNFGFSLVEVDRDRLRVDFYDVLNTEENGGEIVPPQPEDIVLTYSWCGTRKDIGHPRHDVGVCP